MSSARMVRIAPVMEEYVDARCVVEMSTMISRHGEIVHAEQFGFRHSRIRTTGRGLPKGRRRPPRRVRSASTATDAAAPGVDITGSENEPSPTQRRPDR